MTKCFETMSADVMVTSACGHTVDFDLACVGRDRFLCPVCGMRWHVEQDAPRILPSGFVMPGARRVVVDEMPGTKGEAA